MEKSRVYENVYLAMMNKTFNHIIGKTFVNGIPIDKSEMTKDTRRGISSYSNAVLESAGGINLLTNAIINSTNPRNKRLLLDVFDVCDKTSKEVATRVATEATTITDSSIVKTQAKRQYNPSKIVKAIKIAANECIQDPAIESAFYNTSLAKVFDMKAEGNATVLTIVKGSDPDTIYDSGYVAKVFRTAMESLSTEDKRGWTIRCNKKDGTITVTPKSEIKRQMEEALEDVGFDFFDFPVPALEAGEDDGDTEETEEGEDEFAEDDNGDEIDDALDNLDDETDDDDNDNDGDEKKDNDNDDGDDKDDDDDKEEEKEKADNPALTIRSIQTANIDAKMTDAEYNTFVRRANSLDTTKISEIVNDKITSAINDEKETYHQMDDSNNRLKEAIMKDESVADDEAAESIAAGIIDTQKRKYPSEYGSFFSKLQLMAVESIMLKRGIDFSKFDKDICTDITVNYTFDTFGKAPATESVVTVLDKAIAMKAALECGDFDDCNDCDDFDEGEIMIDDEEDFVDDEDDIDLEEENIEPPIGAPVAKNTKMDKCVALGTAFATIIATLLETLNTMGLTNVNPTSVKNMVNANTTVGKRIDTITKDADAHVDAAVEDFQKAVNHAWKSRNSNTLESIIYSAAMLKDKIAEALDSGIDVNMENMTKLDEIILTGRERYNALESVTNDISDADIAIHDRRQQNDVIAINKVSRYLGMKKPSDILVKVNESANGIGLDITGYRAGKEVYNTNIGIDRRDDFVPLQYARAILSRSDIKDLGANIEIR